MKLKELLEKLSPETEIIVKLTNVHSGEANSVYQGRVENVPYTLVDEPIDYEECIEIENNTLIITTGSHVKRKTVKNNQEWLDSLNEEDTLLHLMGIIYHYDVGTIRYEEENFDESYWGNKRDDMLTFCEERLGNLLRGKKLKEWYGIRSERNDNQEIYRRSGGGRFE